MTLKILTGQPTSSGATIFIIYLKNGAEWRHCFSRLKLVVTETEIEATVV